MHKLMMREKFLMDLIDYYQRYFSESLPVKYRKTAALIAFRFAIPDAEINHICKLLIETEPGELETVVYRAYRFYISEPFRGALAYILIHNDLPLSEIRFGLTDARRQSRTRIQNTKKGERFVMEQMQRIERINRSLLLLGEEMQNGEDLRNI